MTVGLSAAGVPSVAGNLGAGRQRGDYASVAEQAGIRAGDGGFGIRIAGNTDLKGAVIASTATVDRNSLATGTLTTSDIANRERYSARQTSLGGGISFGAINGVGKTSEGGATAGTDKSNDLPGVKVAGLGTVSATPPVVLSASGSQSSTTKSAIAPGMIMISSGDAASEQAAQTISRDTGNANPALTQAFDQARRAEIAQGFEAAQTLTNQVGTFLDIGHHGLPAVAVPRIASAVIAGEVMVHPGVQGALGQRLLQRIQQAALVKGSTGRAARKQLVEQLVWYRRFFAS